MQVGQVGDIGRALFSTHKHQGSCDLQCRKAIQLCMKMRGCRQLTPFTVMCTNLLFYSGPEVAACTEQIPGSKSAIQ